MFPRRQLINVAIIIFLLTFTCMKLQERYTHNHDGLSDSFNATSRILIDTKERVSQVVHQDRFTSEIEHDRKQPDPVREKVPEPETDWSRFAYVLYATEPAYLCNAVMIIEQLYGLGAKPDLVLLYSNTIDLSNSTAEGSLIIKARDEYRAVVKPVEILRKEVAEQDTWAAAHTKFIAFNQTDYDRVLHLDSDASVLQTMDELFLLPDSPMAMPRAYWIAQSPEVVLCSALMLIKPSSHEYDRVLAEASNSTKNEYDMEMVNDLYRNEAIVLPHHPYAFLTGEFRNSNHKSYLGEDGTAVWSPDEAFKKAKYLHFSDYPLPKPWISPEPSLWKDEMPKCHDEDGNLRNGFATNDCRDREIWIGIHEDFRKRRTDVCGADFSVKPYASRPIMGSRRKHRIEASSRLLAPIDEEEGQIRELRRKDVDIATASVDAEEVRAIELV